MHVLSAIIIAMDCSHHDSDSRPFNLSLSFYERRKKTRKEIELFFLNALGTKGRTISVELRMPQQKETKIEREKRIHQSSENENESKRNETKRKPNRIKRIKKMQNTRLRSKSIYQYIKIAIFVRLQKLLFRVYTFHISFSSISSY